MSMWIELENYVWGIKEEDRPQVALGRMYLSMTSLGAAEDHTSGIIRHLADIRGNDQEKRRKSIKLIGIGIVAGLIGAAIFPL